MNSECSSHCRRLRVASIGAGYFSRFHVDAWQRIDAVEHVAISDIVPANANWAGVRVFDDALKMCREVQPDIVDIATPPATHLGLLSDLLSLNVKVIICQKPFCGNLSDARTAIQMGLEAGIPIVVHENFRFQPWYRLIRSEIAAGSCGEVYQFTFRLRTGDGQGPNAYLDRQPYFQTMPKLLVHETGVHWVDTFRYLLGEPQSVFADLRKLNPVIAGEDAGYFIFNYGDGSRALFDGNRLLDSGASDNRLTLGDGLVEGSKASLRLDGDGSVHKRVFGSTESEILLPAKEYKGFGGDCVMDLQQHVVDALSQGVPFENEASQYLRNMEIVEAIYASSQAGTRISLAAPN